MYTRGKVIVQLRGDNWSHELGLAMADASRLVGDFLENTIHVEPFTAAHKWLESQYNDHPLLNIGNSVDVTERHDPERVDLGYYFTFCGYHTEHQVAFFWFLPHSAKDDGAQIRQIAQEVVGASPDALTAKLEFELGFVLVPLSNTPQDMVAATLLVPHQKSLNRYWRFMLPTDLQEEMLAAMDE